MSGDDGENGAVDRSSFAEGGGGRRLLLWIGAGAIVGIVVGGTAPQVGVGLDVVEEISR